MEHDISKNLKELRKSKKMSVRTLGDAIDLSYNTIASYERCQIIPTINNALKICEYFNVPVEYLLYGKKMISKFNDSTLYRQFKVVDTFEEEDKTIAKRYMKKFIKNVKERKKIVDESY